MADPKTWVDMVPKYRVAGVEQTRRVFDKRTVVGPASYAADGIPVDLSAVFSTLDAVRILRAYVTSTGAPDSRVYEVNEVGTDTLANRKFRVKVFRATTPGTATDVNVLKATGAPANVTAINAATNSGSCGSVGCDSDHPNGASSVTNILQASGASKATVVTGLTAATSLKTEIDAATNLSTVTVEYEAVGVPA